MNIRTKIKETLLKMQEDVTKNLLSFDPDIKFQEDIWKRSTDLNKDEGGGITRIFSDGEVFERGGVNFSEVYGSITKELCEVMPGAKEGGEFYATGTSLVIHPRSPKIPTVHANYRFMQCGEGVHLKSWFGGGADLTPYTVNYDDFIHFHTTLKDGCDLHDKDYYPRFKKWCDEYFYLPHRKESRGIGGIFFDYLGIDEPSELPRISDFVGEMSSSFCQTYFPIVERRIAETPTQREREFQLYRRGRYVEFNLLYDRGTKFGLKSNGRVESILMSLPPHANWEYCFKPNLGEEEQLFDILKKPREWIGINLSDQIDINSVAAPSLNVG